MTCGGLCPGLNDVVQGLVKKCTDYGVPEGNIIGIRYGFKGFYDKKARPVVLTKKSVEGIHLDGGTMLGTSRGGADIRCAGAGRRRRLWWRWRRRWAGQVVGGWSAGPAGLDWGRPGRACTPRLSP